jgi:hypothetical protein
MIPNISKYLENKVVKNQSNKCARKPYSRISGLENYHCTLWKKRTKRGIFIDKNYCIIKNDNRGTDTADNLIALCSQCFKVLQNRKKQEPKEKSDDESCCSENEENCHSEDEENYHSEDVSTDSNEFLLAVTKSISTAPPFKKTSDYINTSSEKIIAQYKVIYYPNRPGIINIQKEPLVASKLIAHAYYGDILDVRDVILSGAWIKIIYENKIGFVKVLWDGHVVVEKIDLNKKINDNNRDQIKTCCVCTDNILEKIALIPCGHTKICNKCAQKIKQDNQKCPICKQKIEQYMRIWE